MENHNLVSKSILVVGMLASGSVNTITKKVQNDCTANGIENQTHTFQHPWFQTAVMFSGECCCYFIFALGKAKQRKNSMKSNSFPKGTSVRNVLLFVIPTLLDILGTSFGGIGLLWVSPSIWQMMRGTIIIFSGILSAIFLKRKLYLYRWIGMFVTAMGLLVVGMSPFFGGDQLETNEFHMFITGIVFIVAGQFCNAIQMIIEEKFLKDKNFPPLQVVGMEGIWGFSLMVFLILPVMYFVPGDNEGSYENSLDALVMIKQNPVLLVNILFYLISIAIYNFCGLSVTKKLTAVHRTLIDALRTICVWTIDLFIYYCISSSFGEAWNSYSWIELIGFGMLVFGTLIYNAVIKFPLLYYEPAALASFSNAVEDQLVEKITMNNDQEEQQEKEENQPLLSAAEFTKEDHLKHSING